MRDATRPRLLADVAAEVLHDRGLLTLNEMLDAGRLLTVDREVLVACAKLVGGVWLGPAVAASGAAILEDYFGERLAHDLLVANPDTVPERELRDLEWAYTLMGDGTSAHRFLESLPPEVRCEAEFVCDPDGQWRLKGLKVFFPLTAETPTPVRPALGE